MPPQRPMHVDAKDWTPPSALRGMLLSAMEILGGIGFAGAIALLLGIVIAVYALASELDLSVGNDGSEVIEEEVIAARFVKLGRRFEELPNRNVPVRDTAPAQGVAVSTNPRERVDIPDAGPRPPDPMDDPMTRLLNRADLFAEIAEQREQEGDPNGIDEGTETEASDGNVYAGQIYSFFRRGWGVPETISRDDLQNLNVEVTITVGEDLQLQDFRLRGSSDNPDFDQSVLAQLERLRAANTPIPEPPILVRTQYVGNPFTLRFRGRHASQ
ncbi:MAG: TonB C-terminal domain-containing protein [Sandaracinus sp.]|nr:TonB C-terminal domain-containing protein [Sandaracinus sp.]MCB9635531.1 TonB C-terminal domain-containing protein [Sandaracinus sp.]